MAGNNKYELIMKGKSLTMINPSIGCDFHCSYCNGSKNTLKKNYGPNEVLDQIKDSILIDTEPLLFYGYSDPFLGGNSNDLINLLKFLDKDGYHNKVSLITKINPGIEVIRELSHLENLRLGVFVSYANLIPGIESPSVKGRLDLMRDLYNNDVPVACYVSPLCREWLPEKGLEQLANNINGRVNAVALSGINITPEVSALLSENFIQIPQTLTAGKKFLPEVLSTEAKEVLGRITGLPIFLGTSEAMSHFYAE